MGSFCNRTFQLCPSYVFPRDPGNFDNFEDFEEFEDFDDFGKEQVDQTQIRALKIGEIFEICIMCLGSFSLLSNGTIITTYAMMKPNRRKIPNFMLFNQAIVDTMISVYALLGNLPSHIRQLQRNKIYGLVTILLGHYTVFLSLGVLLLTSGERFLALRKPFFHRRFVSKTKMIVGIFIVYFVASLPCIFYLIFLREAGDHDPAFFKIYGSVRVAFVFFGIIVVLGLLYLSYRAVRNAIRERRSSSPILTRRAQISERRKERKMICIFITMATVFTISYLPMAVFNTIRGFFTEALALKQFDMFIIELVGFLLYIASAFINPLLTLTLKDDFKRRINSWRKKRFHNDHHATEPLRIALATATTSV